MNIINLTNQDIIIYTSERIHEFKASLHAKVEACYEVHPDGQINGIPVTRSRVLFVTGLPRELDGEFYIVERSVAEAEPSRQDLLVPAGVVADLTGKIPGIIGYRRFERVSRLSDSL